MSPATEVRRLGSLDEYRQCEELQARVWGPEDVVRVPALVMVAAQINGGFAFGAFGGGQLVGFVLASPGLTEQGHVRQCSILMAVDPAYRNNGIGYSLKLAQREAASLGCIQPPGSLRVREASSFPRPVRTFRRDRICEWAALSPEDATVSRLSAAM